MKNNRSRPLLGEEWVIVAAGALLLAVALLYPAALASLPRSLAAGAAWLDAGRVFLLLALLTCLAFGALRRSLRGVLPSLLVIFALTLGAQLTASIPLLRRLGLEPVFFSVIYGLIISNVWHVPAWLRPAVQSEFYIKIGIVCLGATILFGEVLHSGAYALVQSVVVVFTVWYFAFWAARRMRVDEQMATMLASSVSICGVSAAIATCGAIEGDSRKLGYVISLVLVCAIPMMYLMPWLARLILPAIIDDPATVQQVAGAWMGGTIDTTGAVVASGSLLGETAERSAVIVKSAQNVLLGIAAFAISLYWSYRGGEGRQRPTAAVIWARFPKFVAGFVLASLVFSFFFAGEAFAPARAAAKGMSNTLFSLAFVCIGLETRFRELFSRENRRPLRAFLVAQGFNVVVTFAVALLLFGVLKPMLS